MEKKTCRHSNVFFFERMQFSRAWLCTSTIRRQSRKRKETPLHFWLLCGKNWNTKIHSRGIQTDLELWHSHLSATPGDTRARTFQDMLWLKWTASFHGENTHISWADFPSLCDFTFQCWHLKMETDFVDVYGYDSLVHLTCGLCLLEYNVRTWGGVCLDSALVWSCRRSFMSAWRVALNTWGARLCALSYGLTLITLILHIRMKRLFRCLENKC